MIAVFNIDWLPYSLKFGHAANETAQKQHLIGIYQATPIKNEKQRVGN